MLAIGFPAERLEATVTTCTVLGDKDAERAIALLREEGDEEGEIPYDRSAEVVCEGRVRAGMSGGGVFGTDGKLVGALVRGSSWDGGDAELDEVGPRWA